MKKILLTTLAALICITTHADDIIVYKHNFTVNRTGAGTLTKNKVTGWTIIDGDTGDLSIVQVDVPRKRFSIHEPIYQVESVSAPLGKTHTVFKVVSGNFDGMTIKGLDKRTDIWVLDFYSIPGSAAVGGSDLFQLSPGGEYFFDEYKGTWAYDKPNTSTPFNRTMETKVQAFKNQLLAKGYTEEIIAGKSASTK